MSERITLGAVYLGENRCRFRVWAPRAESMALHLVAPEERLLSMDVDEYGTYTVTAEGVAPGARYTFRLNGKTDRPDPASRFQPEGVHGPSEVVDPHFAWTDTSWGGIALRDHVFYELHVGTFTPEGTFEAIVPRLRALRELGVTSLEIMPVSQFPGERNWGYDGVQPFAVQNSYGGPNGFKRFINACHLEGLSVTLDVVYNHFGPEGNYTRDFGPYFTGRYNTPWGEAINVDDAYSDHVRDYFIQNALYWLEDYHIDALRLDAVHAIFDQSATPFLQELAARVEAYARESGRKRYLIAESDLNDSRLIRSPKEWGYGLDAQWSDDFHHALHSLLTGERDGYYSDFGRLDQLATAIRQGFVYAGSYSRYRRRRHGNRSDDLPAEHFVIATQNHDQIGNRLLGERLSALVGFEAQKLAAGVLLLTPAIPLIFNGQEYGEEAPFLYFVSHTDPALLKAVSEGRHEEFKAFAWKESPPDPAEAETFIRSKLHWETRTEGRHGSLLELYRTLLQLRREIPALKELNREALEVRSFEKVIALLRRSAEGDLLCLFNFSESTESVALDGFSGTASGELLLDSADARWGGPSSRLPARLDLAQPIRLNAHAFAVYRL